MLKRFPDIATLAGTNYETFFPYYQWLGYYSRARNILKTAGIVQDTYQWIFPHDISILSTLPGVWLYTSRAIMAFGYGEPYLAWDTNLEKVFTRYYHGSRLEKLTNSEKEEIENDFRKYIERERGHESQVWNVRATNNALMDFASIVDLKNKNLIDWEAYPIKSGLWYETRGNMENIEIKKVQNFPTPDAQIVVILHKDHKVYYSNTYWKWEERKYTPFILPASGQRDIRWYVQDYFRSGYLLEVSVRPPHRKWLDTDGSPYLAVNAQIQVGEVNFALFERSEVKNLLP
jgi:adenine-specific DNA glycosylase